MLIRRVRSERSRHRPRHRRFAASVIGVLCALLVAGASALRAQAVRRDSTPARPDSLRAGTPAAAAVRGPVNSRTRFTPPITPRRAFIYSSALPGFGQSRLDRGSSGALFAAVELSAVVMLRRSQADLREARRYLADTLPANFNIGPSGTPTPTAKVVGRYSADLVRTRRLHVEDWLAVLAFNHLFAGADAFVAAQLWDMPVQLTATPSINGPLVVASFRF